MDIERFKEEGYYIRKSQLAYIVGELDLSSLTTIEDLPYCKFKTEVDTFPLEDYEDNRFIYELYDREHNLIKEFISDDDDIVEDILNCIENLQETVSKSEILTILEKHLGHSFENTDIFKRMIGLDLKKKFNRVEIEKWYVASNEIMLILNTDDWVDHMYIIEYTSGENYILCERVSAKSFKEI